MTNNTVISIDVSHFPDSIRQAMPEVFGASTNCGDALATEIHGKQPQLAPAAYKTIFVESDRVRLASHIIADLDVPATVVGPQFEHGTSVFAAGHAALELARIELARACLSKDTLDALRIRHVALENVPATFLLRLDTSAITTSVSRGMTNFARMLGRNIEHGCSPDTIAYRYNVRPAHNRTEAGNSESPEDFVVTVVSRPAQKLIRIDVGLTRDFLRSRGWDALDTWEHAYAEGRYELIFKETVRKLFRLDEPQFCLDEPGDAVTERLDTAQKGMLREYLAHKDLMAQLRFGPVLTETRKKKALNVLRESILLELGIDIDIPWRSFQMLSCPVLKRYLQYPGDFQPAAEDAPAYFCEEDWPELLKRMRQAYEDVAVP